MDSHPGTEAGPGRSLRPGVRHYRYHGYAVDVVVLREEPDVEQIRFQRDRFNPQRPMTGKLLAPLPARYRRRIRREDSLREAQERNHALGIVVPQPKPKAPEPYTDFRRAA